jgi:hypothetical protein
MNGPVFHRGIEVERELLRELGTGDENRFRFVGLITPDIAPTGLMLG